ncbi:hypothetical protein GCM10027074_48600 [Streptomyces deserti]
MAVPGRLLGANPRGRADSWDRLPVRVRAVRVRARYGYGKKPVHPGVDRLNAANQLWPRAS